MKEIYFDEAATTKVDPKIVKEMTRFFLDEYGNASSLHAKGEGALKAMNKARKILASEINAKPYEIYFTSGGTESDNWAIQGLAKANPKKKKIIISSIEHAAINECCNYMESLGYEIVRTPVNNEGIIDLIKLEKEIDPKTLLVSVMHVNNIIGVIQDIEKIGEICRKKKVIFHTDAIQSYGKVNIDVKKMNIDLLSASAHKLHGPKGIGLLYVKEGVNIEPIIYGGGQEKNLRSGTENIAGIASFAKALDVKHDANKTRKIRDYIISEIEKLGGKINGSKERRIYNNVHASFPGIDNGNLIAFLSKNNIYVSAGSACDSKKEKEDHVLKAIGLTKKDMESSIRITLDDNSMHDAKKLIQKIKEFIKFNQ